MRDDDSTQPENALEIPRGQRPDIGRPTNEFLAVKGISLLKSPASIGRAGTYFCSQPFPGLAITRPLWYLASSTRLSQRVCGPVAQPDRATVS